MIVSTPYRCGGTSFCIEQARMYGLTFAGQIDPNTLPFTRSEDKNAVHEHKNQPDHTVDTLFDIYDRGGIGYVVLNNSNPALFKQSTHFLLREDIGRVYSSMVELVGKMYPRLNDVVIDSMFKRITYFNVLYLTHLKRYNIAPLILEEQPWFQLKKQSIVPQVLQEKIKPHIEFLKETGYEHTDNWGRF